MCRKMPCQQRRDAGRETGTLHHTKERGRPVRQQVVRLPHPFAGEPRKPLHLARPGLGIEPSSEQLVPNFNDLPSSKEAVLQHRKSVRCYPV